MKNITRFTLVFLLWTVSAAAQSPTLLPPFNQAEIEASKQEKALAATQEYQAKEAELKANTALPNNERQKLRDTNYWAYLKKMEGVLNKDQREKARTALVENDVKGLRAKPALPRLYDQLGLSEEQTTKAKDLNLQQRIKTRTVYHSGNFSPEDRTAENKYINEDFTKKFNDLLTADQRKKLADLRQQDAILAKITLPPLYQKLGLNGTQSDQLKRLLLDRQLKLDAMNKDTSLAAEAKQQQINALNGETDKNAIAILNKDQKIKLEDLMREANYTMPPFYAQLALNEEQQAKLKEAILWQAHEATVLRQDTKLTPEQKQQAMIKLNEGVMARFMAFMSQEQFAKLNALLQAQAKPKQ